MENNLIPNLKTKLPHVTAAPASTNVTVSCVPYCFLSFGNVISQPEVPDERSRYLLMRVAYSIVSDEELRQIASPVHQI